MPEPDSPFQFQANDPLPGNDEYVIVHSDLGADEGLARWVGCGGAGVVYRAGYKQLMERAIKILAPEASADGTIASAYERTFRNEIAVLSQITHTRVAKIMDFGTLEYDGLDYPWYAMEYIEGKRFDTVLLENDLSRVRFG